FLHMSNVTFDMAKNRMDVHENNAEPWRVTLVDTGDDTMTGGRLKRVGSYIGNEDFCFTYGDGVSDIDIPTLLKHHKSGNTLATLTAVQPPGRFGALNVRGNLVTSFQEKPKGEGGWINGGFFVLSPKVLDYVGGDDTIWERDPMEKLATEANLAAYFHEGFWHAMDTLRDKNYLEELWSSGRAPWKRW
ncbi:MAG: glucose-phosphate cytidylyltransferase, partial [Betaproteobacteria bacterium]|nr:glucose-phosphate cytidylyltransferase [Betaproteobacteria bacterium]